MEPWFESIFDGLYAAYRAARTVFRSVDLMSSVVVNALRFVAGVLFRLAVVAIIELLTIVWSGCCLFIPDSDDALTSFIRSYSIVIAFSIFAAGQSLAIAILFWMFHGFFTWKFEYIYNSDTLKPRDAGYRPFDDGATDAGDDDPVILKF